VVDLMLDMGMQDPKPTFGYLVTQLRRLHPALSYIHVIEPRDVPIEGSNDFIRQIWVGNVEDGHDIDDVALARDGRRRVIISAGGYTRDLGMEYAETKGDLIAYGKLFLANVRCPSLLCPRS
jgi:NADPH2 dehydrogenase